MKKKNALGILRDKMLDNILEYIQNEKHEYIQMALESGIYEPECEAFVDDMIIHFNNNLTKRGNI